MMVESSRPVILLVKERGSLRKLLGRTLRDAGYEVRTTATIRPALMALRDDGFPLDLAVMDPATGDLPVGLLADELRKLRPRCRTIVLSGHPSPVAPDPERPWIRHLGRPFNLDELLRDVEEALSDDGATNGRGNGMDAEGTTTPTAPKASGTTATGRAPDEEGTRAPWERTEDP